MSETSFRPFARQNVRDHIKRALHAAIISGEMEAGQVYSAPALGAKFGVSPTPVREAMLELAKEGLVSTVPNKGFRVSEVDDKYLDEITELRQLIEPPVVRDVVHLIPIEDIPTLQKMAQLIVDHAAERDLVEYMEADRALHLALLEYSGNDRIVRLISDLRGQARLTGLIDLADRGVLADTAREHLAIIDAIADRDQERVYTLMVNHISQTRSTWAGRPKG